MPPPARPFGDNFVLAVRHYLSTNRLTSLGQINGEILADIAQQFHDHHAAQQKTRKKRGEATPEEIAIYEAYPRKVARGNAIISIRSAMPRYRGNLLEVVQRYAHCVARWPNGYRYKEGRDLCPHPATWFNRESYLESEREWLPAGMFTREDDRKTSDYGVAQPALSEPENWSAQIKDHETLGILAPRSWDSIIDFDKKRIIKHCS